MLGNEETCKPIGVGNWLMWYTPLEFVLNQTHHVIIKVQLMQQKLKIELIIFLKKWIENRFF